MSTVTLDIPDDLDDDLEALLEENPHFDDVEDLLLTLLRGVLEKEEATMNVRHATDAAERDDSEQVVDALEDALEANARAQAALLEFFGVPGRLSEIAQEKVRQSEREFERGDYVMLTDG
jgi:AcrR family transcriptional regulator